MAPRTHERQLLPYLQRALNSPVGIELEFLTPDDARSVRQKLYALRKEHPEFSPISFLQKGSCLWLLKANREEPLYADPIE